MQRFEGTGEWKVRESPASSHSVGSSRNMTESREGSCVSLPGPKGFRLRSENWKKKSRILFRTVYFKRRIINPAWKQCGFDSLCLLPKNEANKHASMSFPMWPSSLRGQQGLTKFIQPINKVWITSGHIFIKFCFKGAICLCLNATFI